jgi:hypothetical protein
VRWLRSLGQLPGLAVGTLALIPARRIAGRKLAGIPRVRHRETNIRPGGHANAFSSGARIASRADLASWGSPNRHARIPAELTPAEPPARLVVKFHSRQNAQEARSRVDPTCTIAAKCCINAQLTQ